MQLSDREFWALTLAEWHILYRRYALVQARQDRRAALAAWVLANVHRDESQHSEAFTVDEIALMLGHGFVTLPPPPTPEALSQRVTMLNELYGGSTGSMDEADGEA